MKTQSLTAKGKPFPVQAFVESARETNAAESIGLQERLAETSRLEDRNQIAVDSTCTHNSSSEALPGFSFIEMPGGWSPYRSAPDATMDGGRDHEKGRPTVHAAEANRTPSKAGECLPIKSGRKVILLKVSDIDWIGAGHNYITLHVGKQSHLLRGTLDSIELRLPPGKFVRISRSTIVQVDRIKELELLGSCGYRVTLHDGANLTLSRRHRPKLQKMGLL